MSSRQSSSGSSGVPPKPAFSAAAGYTNAGAARLGELSDYYAKAYRGLYRQAMGIVKSREAAEDVVQEAFAKTSTAIVTGTEIRSLGAWLNRCVRNLAINHLHERAALPLHEDFEPLHAPSLPEIADARERCKEVCEALGELSAAQRSAFLLAEIRGFNYREIGVSLGRSEDAVRQLLARARSLVRDAVGPETFGLIPALGLGALDDVTLFGHEATATTPAEHGGRLVGLRERLAAKVAPLGRRLPIRPAAEAALPVVAIVVATLFGAHSYSSAGAGVQPAQPSVNNASTSAKLPNQPGASRGTAAEQASPPLAPPALPVAATGETRPEAQSHGGGETPPVHREAASSGSPDEGRSSASSREADPATPTPATPTPVTVVPPPPTPPRYAYVVSQNSTQKGSPVALLDTTTDIVKKWFKLGPGWSAVAVTPDGSRAYITNTSTNLVKVIDNASDVLAATARPTPIPVGTSPSAIAISTRSPRAYVANKGSDSISVIDTTENPVANPVGSIALPPGSSPSAVAVSPDGHLLFVANEGPGVGAGEPGTISAVDLSPGANQNQIVGSVPAGAEPSAMVISPDGRKVYVANKGAGAAGTVSVIDAVTGAPAGAPVPAGNGPVGMAVMPDLGSPRIVVANKGSSGELSLLDGASGGVDRIPLTSDQQGAHFMSPFAVAVTPDGSRAYSTHVVSGEVASVDLAARSVKSLIAVDPYPRAIAIVPNQGPTARAPATQGVAGTPATLDASTSSDADGYVAEYRWSFGDGSTATTTQPVVEHTYANPRSYTAVLTVIDNEKASVVQVGDGRTLSQNGSPRAITKVPVSIAASPTTTPTQGGGGGGGQTTPTPGGGGGGGQAGTSQGTSQAECVRLLNGGQLSSVSHWKLQDGVAFRAMVAPGGFFLADGQSSSRYIATVQARRAAGAKAAPPAKVSFGIDGQYVGSGARRPYRIAVPQQLATAGKHTFEATVESHGGRTLARSLDFYVLPCAQPALSAGMTGKTPNQETNLKLRFQTGQDAPISAATFTLSPDLRFDPRGLGGRRVGTLRLDGSGAGSESLPLKIKRAKSGAIELAGRTQSGLTATLARYTTGYTVSLGGLDRLAATALTLDIYGRKTGFVKTPTSCRTLTYKSDVRTTDGQTIVSQRGLQMCKGGQK